MIYVGIYVPIPQQGARGMPILSSGFTPHHFSYTVMGQAGSWHVEDGDIKSTLMSHPALKEEFCVVDLK
jgi:hypothetical protein